MITQRKAIVSAVTLRRDRRILQSAEIIRPEAPRRPAAVRVRLACRWIHDPQTGRLSCRWREEPATGPVGAGQRSRLRAAEARPVKPGRNSDLLPHHGAAGTAPLGAVEHPVNRPRTFAM